jgi:hypothetical protein
MRQRALELARRAACDRSVEFRFGQWEAIQALVEGRERLLVVERTGWGKSIVYFVATRLLRDPGRRMFTSDFSLAGADAESVRPTPVLIVGDTMDSRWTFTVLAWKLRTAGSGPVFPFRLADSWADDGNSQ